MNDSLNEATLQHEFAAQPVFDANKKRYALELLSRSNTSVTALQLQPTDAQSLEMLCQKITDYVTPFRVPLLLRVAPEILLAATPLPLVAEQVILTLPPSVQPGKSLLMAIKGYKKQGFRFALYDTDFTADWLPLLALVDIIKLDVTSSILSDIDRHKTQYSRPGLRWLADKVETEQQFSLWRALGCELFQGYFLPDTLSVDGTKIPPATIKLAQIISCLFVEEPDINKLALLLSDEPAIVMGLLNIANSPLYRKTRAVSSVKEIVMRLGFALARKWILTYAVLGGSTPAAAITVLSRAHTVQDIARQWQLDAMQAEQYFLAGLISGSDILFGINSVELLPHLNLSTSIRQALQTNSGRMAQALNIVRTIERGYALKQPATTAELPYLGCYTVALAEVQQRLAEAGA